jgi:hypothetical protein
MLLHKDKKSIILFNMKAGSMSLRNIFGGLDPGFMRGNVGNPDTHNNAFLWMLPKLFPDFDVENELMEYHVGCFYRDPIDRFLSGMAYFLRVHTEFDPNLRPIKYFEECGTWGYQYRWLGSLYSHDSWNGTPWHPVPIHYYNFHDFENEVKRLASDIGFTLRSDQIARVNSSEGNRLHYEDLTQTEIDFLKEYYDPDYKFLASKGLKVPTA